MHRELREHARSAGLDEDKIINESLLAGLMITAVMEFDNAQK